MPVNQDASGNRWVEMHFLAPGTPEQVWRAVATGPGNAAWFTRTSIEERVGGALRFDFGGDCSSGGEVTVWEPPVRFGYVERDWHPGAPPVETEITIEPRRDGQCAVRMIHRLNAAVDTWDHHLENFQAGWPPFFEILRVYLLNFAGQPAASFQVMSLTAGEPLALWRRITAALGVAGVDAGEACTAPGEPQPLSGVVERIEQGHRTRLAILRLSAPAPGLLLAGTYKMGEGVHVSATFYFYGDQAEASVREAEPLWRAWMATHFPPIPGENPAAPAAS